MRHLPVLMLATFLAGASPGALRAQTAADALAAYAAWDFDRAARIAAPLAEAGDGVALHIVAALVEGGLGGYDADPAVALSLYTQAADTGLPEALNSLAIIHHFGRLGLPVNAERAEALYRQAIEAGHGPAMNGFGVLLEEGLRGPVDWAVVLDLYRRAAERDEPHAPGNIAAIYYEGRDGVAPDPELARLWYERSVAADDIDSLAILAFILETGIGGPVDISRAVALYTRSADLGVEQSANTLGFLYEQGAPGLAPDLTLAVAWYERAIALDSALARLNLSILLSDGDPGVPDDFARAHQLLSEAHAMGELGSTVELAYLYWDGIGVPVDYVRARDLLGIAVAQGDPRAMNDLAVMVEQGLGAPPDTEGAALLYRRAAEAGFALAANNLSLTLTDPESLPFDTVEGLAWCHFSVARADAEQQAPFQTICDDLAVGVSAADKLAARDRAQALLAQY